MNIDWHGFAPELILTGTLLVVLLVDLVIPRRARWTLAGIAAVGLLATLIPILTLAVEGPIRSMFAGSFVVDDFALVMKGLFVVAGYVVLLISFNTIEEGAYHRGEFYFLLLASILGMFLVASARDLIVLIIAFELFSAPGYMLAAWNKRNRKSNEAGMKYFVLGALSTAILLYGLTLIYGSVGSTNFEVIGASLGAVFEGGAASMVTLGIVLILVGFGFKISAVPFHLWAPDVYEGAPTPVTAFFSVSVKAAGFVGLLLLVFIAFNETGEIWRPLLWALSAVTMTVGNVIALRQTNVVRLLAYSSIAQSGYVIAPLAVVGISPEVSQQAIQAIVLYLLIYAVMNLGAFAIVISVARRTKSGSLDSYNGLFKTMPIHAVIMAFFLASLTGIPPFAGWLGKLAVFSSLAAAGGWYGYTLAVIVVLNAVIGGFVYMRLVRRMFFEQPEEQYANLLKPGEAETPPAPLAAALGGLAVLVVAAGIFPILTYFSNVATIAL